VHAREVHNVPNKARHVVDATEGVRDDEINRLTFAHGCEVDDALNNARTFVDATEVHGVTDK
jgi:hypothetical protein